MDYEKMKALMETAREGSKVQRVPKIKEFPKQDYRTDWKYFEQVVKERIAA